MNQIFGGKYLLGIGQIRFLMANTNWELGESDFRQANTSWELDEDLSVRPLKAFRRVKSKMI